VGVDLAGLAAGQGRRIAKIVRQVDGETVTYRRTDYMYDEQWQVLEERADTFEDLEGEGGALETPAETPAVQWLWDVRYVDSPVLRWRSVSGTLDEVLYFCDEANMNVTALVNTSGTVVERYVYDAAGLPPFSRFSAVGGFLFQSRHHWPLSGGRSQM
jgi:hypothetical protein